MGLILTFCDFINYIVYIISMNKTQILLDFSDKVGLGVYKHSNNLGQIM